MTFDFSFFFPVCIGKKTNYILRKFSLFPFYNLVFFILNLDLSLRTINKNGNNKLHAYVCSCDRFKKLSEPFIEQFMRPLNNFGY